jgi:hypothetical protein
MPPQGKWTGKVPFVLPTDSLRPSGQKEAAPLGNTMGNAKSLMNGRHATTCPSNLVDPLGSILRVSPEICTDFVIKRYLFKKSANKSYQPTESKQSRTANTGKMCDIYSTVFPPAVLFSLINIQGAMENYKCPRVLLLILCLTIL